MAKSSDAAAFLVSEEFARALNFALRVHGDQPRKGTAIPYVSHLLAVAGSVLDAGGSEEQAIAGLLHDSAEDGAGEATLREIERDFGDEIAGIVRDCSDALPDPGQPKADWETRKRAHLAHIATVRSESLAVLAADKLHNARSIETDLRIHGLATMTRFKGGVDGSIWYLDEMHAALVARNAPLALTVPLGATVASIRSLVNELRGT